MGVLSINIVSPFTVEKSYAVMTTHKQSFCRAVEANVKLVLKGGEVVKNLTETALPTKFTSI